MKILVKYTCIEIHGYKLGSTPDLEKHFTLYDKVRHCSYLSGVEYNEDKNILIIPRGVDIFFIENLLNTKARYCKKSDPYDIKVLDGTRVKFLPRDDLQKKAIRFMTSQGEYHNYKGSSSRLVSLGTGKGKTYCSIVSAIMLGYRTMVITSSIEWLAQWKKCILEYCDKINKKEVYTISGVHTIYKILNKPEMIQNIKFILVSDSTIRSYGERYGWDKVEELFKLLRIGIKIYDECHLHFDSMRRIDFHSNTNLTFYLTATPLRSKEDENHIFQLYFKNIPYIESFDEEKDPHTNYIAIKFNSKPSIIEREKCGSFRYGLDRNKYINYITDNENFYKLLKLILKIIKGKKTLIYIGINNSIMKVYDWIVENYPEFQNEIGIYTTLIKDKTEKEKQLDKLIILSTTKSTGTAMDIHGLEYTVVLAEPFKSEVLARQTLGRTRGDNTNYIEVVDMGFKQLSNYYRHKLPVFKKYALSVTEILVDQERLDNE